MRDKIKEMANNNIGSLCLFLKNDKNKSYLNEILSNIPDGIDDLSLSEKVLYYLSNNDIQVCKCGEFKKFIGFKNGWRETCGKIECVVNSRKDTCIEKWGVDNPKKSKEILEKEKENIKKRWNGEHYMKSDSVQNKFKKTMNERWGVDWAQQSTEISSKSIETWNNNENKDEIKEKRKESFMKTFNENKDEILLKKDNTIKENWGSKENLYDHINSKIREKSIENWGTDHHLSSSEIILKRVNSYQETITKKITSDLPENIRYINRKCNKNNTDIIIKLFCIDCNEITEINRQYLVLRKNGGINPCMKCVPQLSGKSGLEIELLNFIKENYNGQIISNTKSIIDGEIDIYLPDINLAFEFNGLYWHSEEYKNKLYHKRKTDSCLELGINLIHIWEDDWIYKKDIVKSMILNRIGKSLKIGARKCEIIDLSNSNDIVRNFLNENHIQGWVTSKYKFGLSYNEELVCLITFGKLRKVTNNNGGDYELLRFCNKKEVSVIGGFSKLLNYFIKNNNIKKVISYSDTSRGLGDVYNKIGFNLISETEPNYYWVIDGVRKHRFNYIKDILVKMGNSDKMSEIEIMNSLGHNRIFDCGSKKWEINI